MAERRGRGLSGEERALWHRAMRDTRRLRNRQPAPEVEAAEASEDVHEPSATPTPRTIPVRAPARPAAPQLTGIDRRTAQRLKRGQIEVEARLDLHGMTQAAAHAALARFLTDAQARGQRLVLVITGKGGVALEGERTFGAVPRGVLKHKVPHWLGESAMAHLVAGIAPAHARHGGAGALYVRLRKRA